MASFTSYNEVTRTAHAPVIWTFLATDYFLIDAYTTDHTSAYVTTFHADVNSASVDNLRLQTDVGTALSSGEIVKSLYITTTGLAADDDASLLYGIDMIVTGAADAQAVYGTRTEIVMSGLGGVTTYGHYTYIDNDFSPSETDAAFVGYHTNLQPDSFGTAAGVYGASTTYSSANLSSSSGDVYGYQVSATHNLATATATIDSVYGFHVATTVGSSVASTVDENIYNEYGLVTIGDAATASAVTGNVVGTSNSFVLAALSSIGGSLYGVQGSLGALLDGTVTGSVYLISHDIAAGSAGTVANFYGVYQALDISGLTVGTTNSYGEYQALTDFYMGSYISYATTKINTAYGHHVAVGDSYSPTNAASVFYAYYADLQPDDFGTNATKGIYGFSSSYASTNLSASSGYVYGHHSSISHDLLTATATVDYLYGYYSTVTVGATVASTVDQSIYSFYGSITVGDGAAASIVSGSVYGSYNALTLATAATVTGSVIGNQVAAGTGIDGTTAGVYFLSHDIASGSAGTVTNLYGVYQVFDVSGLTIGTSNSYGIYQSLTDFYMGDYMVYATTKINTAYGHYVSIGNAYSPTNAAAVFTAYYADLQPDDFGTDAGKGLFGFDVNYSSANLSAASGDVYGFRFVGLNDVIQVIDDIYGFQFTFSDAQTVGATWTGEVIGAQVNLNHCGAATTGTISGNAYGFDFEYTDGAVGSSIFSSHFVAFNAAIPSVGVDVTGDLLILKGSITGTMSSVSGSEMGGAYITLTASGIWGDAATDHLVGYGVQFAPAGTLTAATAAFYGALGAVVPTGLRIVQDVSADALSADATVDGSKLDIDIGTAANVATKVIDIDVVPSGALGAADYNIGAEISITGYDGDDDAAYARILDLYYTGVADTGTTATEVRGINLYVGLPDLVGTSDGYAMYLDLNSALCTDATGGNSIGYGIYLTNTGHLATNTTYGCYFTATWDFAIAALAPVMLSSLVIAPGADPTPYPLNFELGGWPGDATGTAGVYSQGRVITMQYTPVAGRTLDGTLYGIYSDFNTNLAQGGQTVYWSYVDIGTAEESNAAYGLYITKGLTNSTAVAGVAQTNNAIYVTSLNATSAAASGATTVGNTLIDVIEANSTSVAMADVYSGTMLSLAYTATTTGAGTATNTATGLMLDYNLIETAGTLTLNSFNVAYIDYDTTGTVAYAAGTYNLFYINATDAAIPAYAGAATFNGLNIDVSAVNVASANLTLHGITVTMPAAYSTATEAAIWASGYVSTIGILYENYGYYVNVLDANMTRGFSADLEVFPTGRVFDASYSVAETLLGTLHGLYLDFSTNVTHGSQQITGWYLSLPATDYDYDANSHASISEVVSLQTIGPHARWSVRHTQDSCFDILLGAAVTVSAGETWRGIRIYDATNVLTVGAGEAAVGVMVDLDSAAVANDATAALYGEWIQCPAGAGANSEIAGIRIDPLNNSRGLYLYTTAAGTACIPIQVAFAEYQGGTVFSVSYPVAETLTGTLTGISLDFTTNVTPGDNAVTGLSMLMPQNVAAASYGISITTLADRGSAIYVDCNLAAGVGGQTVVGGDFDFLNAAVDAGTLYGVRIQMPAAYGAATEAALIATGNGDTVRIIDGNGIYVQMREAGSIALNMDIDQAADTANDQIGFSVTKDMSNATAGALAMTNSVFDATVVLTNSGAGASTWNDYFIDLDYSVNQSAAGTPTWSGGFISMVTTETAGTNLFYGNMVSLTLDGTVDAGQTLRGYYLNADTLVCGAGESFYAIDLDLSSTTVGGNIYGLNIVLPATFGAGTEYAIYLQGAQNTIGFIDGASGIDGTFSRTNAHSDQRGLRITKGATLTTAAGASYNVSNGASLIQETMSNTDDGGNHLTNTEDITRVLLSHSMETTVNPATDAVGATLLDLTFSSTTTNATDNANVTVRAIDITYTTTETGGNLNLNATDIFRLNLDVGAGTNILNAGTGDLNMMLLDGDGFVPGATVVNAANISALTIDWSTASVNDADASLFGARITMPSTNLHTTCAIVEGLRILVDTAVNIDNDMSGMSISKDATMGASGTAITPTGYMVTFTSATSNADDTAANDLDNSIGGISLTISHSAANASAGQTDQDTFSGTGFYLAIDADTDAATAKLAVTKRAVDIGYNIDRTAAGVLTLDPTDIWRLNVDVAAGVVFDSAGDLNMMFLDGDDFIPGATATAATNVVGFRIDLSSADLGGDASFTEFRGIRIDMPANYAANGGNVGANSAIHATGNGNVFDALLGDGVYLLMGEAGSVGLDIFSDTTDADNAKVCVVLSKDMTATGGVRAMTNSVIDITTTIVSNGANASWNDGFIDVDLTLTETADTLSCTGTLVDFLVACGATDPDVSGGGMSISYTGSGVLTAAYNGYYLGMALNHDGGADDIRGMYVNWTGNMPGTAASTLSLVDAVYTGTVGAGGALGTVYCLKANTTGATQTSGVLAGVGIVTGASGRAMIIDCNTTAYTADLTTGLIDIDVNVNTTTGTTNFVVADMAVTRAATDSGKTYGWSFTPTISGDYAGDLAAYVAVFGSSLNATDTNNDTHGLYVDADPLSFAGTISGLTMDYTSANLGADCGTVYGFRFAGTHASAARAISNIYFVHSMLTVGGAANGLITNVEGVHNEIKFSTSAQPSGYAYGTYNYIYSNAGAAANIDGDAVGTYNRLLGVANWTWQGHVLGTDNSLSGLGTWGNLASDEISGIRNTINITGTTTGTVTGTLDILTAGVHYGHYMALGAAIPTAIRIVQDTTTTDNYGVALSANRTATGSVIDIDVDGVVQTDIIDIQMYGTIVTNILQRGAYINLDQTLNSATSKVYGSHIDLNTVSVTDAGEVIGQLIDLTSMTTPGNSDYVAGLEILMPATGRAPAIDTNLRGTKYGRIEQGAPFFYDDMWAGELHTAWGTRVTTGAVTKGNGLNGTVTLTTGALATNEESVDFLDDFNFDSALRPTFECRVNPADVDNDTNIFIGLADTNVLAVYDGTVGTLIGFLMSHSATGTTNWYLQSSRAGAGSRDAGAAAGSGAWVVLRFEFVADDTVEWFINGTSQGTITGVTVPATGVALQPVLSVLTDAVAAKAMSVDKVKIWQDGA